MKSYILIILVGSIINNIISISNIDYNLKNYGYQIRNTGLRMILLKKKYPILLNKIKEFYEFWYNKSINCYYSNICNYNSLTEDDKLLLETIISFFY